MRNITVYFNSTLPHFTQMMTGLEYLKERNLINLQYELQKFNYPPFIFKVNCNHLTIFFDMSDNSKIDMEIYQEADFYVKRMLLKKDFLTLNKLLPYGLNYQVYSNNKFLKHLFLKDKRLFKYSLRFSQTASVILNIKDCINNNELSKMDSLPSTNKKILFRNRLWNPDNNQATWKKEERRKLNEERITINRLLAGKYKDNFSGGIQKDSFSVRHAPDLLIEEKKYHKRNYLNVLKESSIGVVTRGLEESISWKFGEYISHSLAIISTPIDEYKLLGPLREKEHYLTFRSNKECLEKTELLFSNDGLRKEMQEANHEYYMNWLHPGQKMLKIFELIENR